MPDYNPSEKAEGGNLPVAEGYNIVVGRTRWAVGLEWSRDLQAASQSAGRAEAQSKGQDLYVLNGESQYGFTSSNRGHRKGQPSLALMLKDMTEGDDLIGAFELADGRFYIICVQDGIVQPAYDQVYDEDEALGLISDIYASEQWAHTYLPDTFYLPDSQAKTLADVLGGKKSSRHKLISTSRRETLIVFGAVLLALGVAYGGYRLYDEYQNEQLLAQGEREERQRLWAEQRIAKMNQPVMPPMPSISAPRGMDVYRSCIRRLAHLPEYIPGWTPTQATCDGASIVLTLKQEGIGTINWVAPFLREHGNPELDSPTDGIVTATWRMDPSGMSAWGDVHGQVPAAVTRYLSSQFQEAYQPYTLGPPVSPRIQTTTVGGNPVAVQAPWTTMDLSFSEDGYLRDDLEPILDRIQNLVITEISEKLPERQWQIRALVYRYVPAPSDGPPPTRP